jgi:hypothetical protein
VIIDKARKKRISDELVTQSRVILEKLTVVQLV